MNRLVAIAGVAVLAVSVIGWAALAESQPDLEKKAAGSDRFAELGGAEPGKETAPFVDAPANNGPAIMSLDFPSRPNSMDKTPAFPPPQAPRILPAPGKPQAMDPPRDEKPAAPPPPAASNAAPN